MNESDAFKAHREALQSHYSHLAAYTNLILGAGYAGFFATWSLTKDHLGRSASLWAGALILVSLFFFVLFEIVRMVYAAVELEKQSRALARSDQYHELMAAFAQVQPRIAYQLRVIWYLFFSIALLTAFCAAAIMMYAFAEQLLCGP